MGDNEDRAPIINLVVQRRFAGTPRSRVMQVAVSSRLMCMCSLDTAAASPTLTAEGFDL